ncbi:MAG: zinc-binding dehydrogenase [Dictyoglomus sp.]|nr:zinc-binding dehydrogenase [Dictyoglomus sp.]MDW8188025.1 zinc-binding dehydrogenase [Dictyoglomus sp.]
MKARSAILEEFGKPLVLKEFDIPELPKNGILVRILASGICGSDIHIISGKDPRVKLPMILGHEGVGEIIEINGEKKDLKGEILKKGDLIIWNRGIVCGECFYCKIVKEPSLCENRKVYGINRSCKDYPYLLGSHSEYIILEEKTDILKLSPNVDPSIMVIAGCSGSTAVHALDSIKESLLGKTVVIQGGGPLGIFALSLARYQGAENIILITGSSERISRAKNIGIDLILDRYRFTEEERIKKVLELTQGRGADVVIEATGVSIAVKEGLKLLRKGGTYLIVGVATPQEDIPINIYEITSKNINIQGIWVSDTKHFKEAVSFIEKHQDIFAPLITHRISLKEINEGLKLMEEKKAVKVVIDKF